MNRIIRFTICLCFYIIACLPTTLAREYLDSLPLEAGSLTGESFQTKAFDATVLTNATHAQIELILKIPLAKVGWISIGHGTRMSNSYMMILWPGNDDSEDEHWITSYRTATGHIIPTPVPPPDVAATFTVHRIDSTNLVQTSLLLTRPLSVSALDTLARAPEQKFVWAISSLRPPANPSTEAIMYHDMGYGTATLNLGKEISPSGVTETRSVRDLTRSYRHDGLITVHATVLSVAWIFCAPAAILSARFMRSKSKHWVRVHWILHICTILLTLIGVICASCAVGAGSHFDSHQKKLGFFVVIGMLVQGFEGYAIHASAKKCRTKRPKQNWLHIIFGFSLVLLSWFTIVFGIKEWEMQGRGTPVAVSVIMGLAMGTALFLYLWGVLRTPQSKGNLASQSRLGQEAVVVYDAKPSVRAHSSLEQDIPVGQSDLSSKDRTWPPLEKSVEEV